LGANGTITGALGKFTNDAPGGIGALEDNGTIDIPALDPI
jgi:hypothetical protein